MNEDISCYDCGSSCGTAGCGGQCGTKCVLAANIDLVKDFAFIPKPKK